jgi:hypothetical protein
MSKIHTFWMTPPPLYLEHNIHPRIIAFRATNLISKAFTVVFKREFLGFRHVGRLEHHAIAPVARLPK